MKSKSSLVDSPIDTLPSKSIGTYHTGDSTECIQGQDPPKHRMKLDKGLEPETYIISSNDPDYLATEKAGGFSIAGVDSCIEFKKGRALIVLARMILHFKLIVWRTNVSLSVETGLVRYVLLWLTLLGR